MMGGQAARKEGVLRVVASQRAEKDETKLVCTDYYYHNKYVGTL